MTTLNQVLQNLPDQNRPIPFQVDYAQGASASTSLGFQEGVLPTTWGVVEKAHAKFKASRDGLEPLTPDQFKTKFGEDEDFPYKAGETLYEAKVRRDYVVNRKRSEFMSSQAGFATQFGFGMLGNLVADGPLAALPASRILSSAKGLKKGVATGDAVYTATKLERAIERGEGVWKTGFKELTKQQLKVQGAESAYVYAASQYADRNYGVADAMLDTVFGTAFAGALSIPALKKAKNISKYIQQFHGDQTAMARAIETADVGDIARILDKNSREFAAAATGRKDVIDALELSPNDIGKPENAHHRKVLMDFITENEDALWFEQIKGLVPRDPDIPITESIIKQMQRAEAIREKIKQGKAEELSPEDLDIVLQADANVEDTKFNIQNSEQTPVEIVAPESTITEGPNGELTDPATGKTWKKPVEGAKNTRWNTLRKQADEAAAKAEGEPKVGATPEGPTAEEWTAARQGRGTLKSTSPMEAQRVRVLDELLSLKQDVAQRIRASKVPAEKRSLDAEKIHLDVLTEIAKNPDDVTLLRRAYHRLDKILNKPAKSGRSYNPAAREIMQFEFDVLTKFLENRNVNDILPLIRERYGIEAPEPVAPKARPNIGRERVPESVSLNYGSLQDSMASFSTNKDTGEMTITLDTDQIKKDWDNGMPYLLGLTESRGSKQKQKVFENVDIDKLRSILKDAEGYEKFILEHEKAHAFHESARYTPEARKKGWLSEEATIIEVAANQYAAKKMGFDWASVEKSSPEKLVAPLDAKLGDLRNLSPLDYQKYVEDAQEYFYAKYTETEADFLIEITHRAGMAMKYGIEGADPSLKADLASLEDAVATGRFTKEDVEAAKLFAVAESSGFELGKLPVSESTSKEGVVRKRYIDRIETTFPDGSVSTKQLEPKKPKVEVPNLKAQSKKLEAELQADSVEKVKAAEARRADKRKIVEEAASDLPRTWAETHRNDMTRIQMLTDSWLPWLSSKPKDAGNSQTGAMNEFKDYLISLIGEVDEGVDLQAKSIRDLMPMVPKDKLDYKVEVLADLYDTKRHHAKARGVGDAYFREPNATNAAFAEPDNIGEQFSREVRRLTLLIENKGLAPADARKQYNDYVDAKESAELLGKLHNESVQRRHDRQLEGKTEKQKLKYLKTFLDGLNRMGVNLRGSSVSQSISAQITTSQAPLFEVLTKHKMVDAFDSDPDDTLIKALMEATRTGKTPEAWQGEAEPVFKEILEVYQMTNRALNVELNKYGAGILFRENHTGVSQRWDGSTMAAKSYEVWRKDMLEHVDWEAVETNMGGVLVGERNEFNFAQKFVDFDKEKYLKSMWEDLTGPKAEMDHPSMDIAKSFGKHRNIVIKPDSEVYMMKRYSGHDSVGRLYLDQIRYRAEMVAIARELGNNPIPNFRKVVADAGIQEGINTTRTGKRFGSKLHDLDVKTLDWTLSNLTGRLDNPVDVDAARYGRTFRQASHLLYLWTSGVSAITDIPLTISTMQQLGVTNSTASLVSAFKRSAKRRLLKEGDTTRRFLTSMGANYDAMMNAGSRHMGLPDSKTSGNLISNLSDMMFSLNGLNQWTGIMQEAFMDVLSRELADSIKVGSLDPSMIRSLRAAGIEADQLLSMKHAITDVMGVDRFDVHKAGDPETVRNLMAFFAKYRDEAIMMPDASTGAMIRGGTRAGTVKGEAMRSLLQYQAFPLAMNRVTARKFLINAEGERPWTTQQVTFSRMVGFMGGMLAMAYVATVVKDILKGREPMHLENMTAASWLRIVNQSGVGGLLQTSMEVGSGNPKALLAPLPSDALKMAGSDSIGEFIYRSRNIWSGGNNPAAPVIQKAVAAVFPDMVGIHFKMLNAYHEQNTGQSPLFWAPNP